MRNAGYGWPEYRAVMTDPLNGCSTWYRDVRDGRSRTAGKHRKSPRGEAGAQAELQRCWAKVARLPEARRMDASDVLARCERTTAAAHQALQGPGRATRLKVLDALCRLAVHYRTVRVLAPSRTVADEAGVHRRTAERCLRDLNAAGLVRHVVTATAANVYALAPCSGKCPDLPLFYGVQSLGTADYTREDAFRHGDLAASGWLIYGALDVAEAACIAEVARATGLHRVTVSRRLRDLADRGLAVRTEDGWTRGATDPAQALGPRSGTARRQAALHAAERDAWQQRPRKRVAS